MTNCQFCENLTKDSLGGDYCFNCGRDIRSNGHRQMVMNMKTEKYIKEMYPPSDLCEVSFSEALKILKDLCKFYPTPFGVYILRCSSQILEDAIVLAHMFNKEFEIVSVQIDCKYKPDEWSLSSILFNQSDGCLWRYAVHSDGA